MCLVLGNRASSRSSLESGMRIMFTLNAAAHVLICMYRPYARRLYVLVFSSVLASPHVCMLERMCAPAHRARRRLVNILFR